MVTGLVIWLLVLLWLQVVLYGNWFGYIVAGFVIWLLAWLYGYWLGYIVTGLVIR